MQTEITVTKKNKAKSIYKKIIVACLSAVLVLSAGIVGGFKYMALYPYAITSDDGVVCYVENKETANEAVQNAVESLTEDLGDAVLVSVGDIISVERADRIRIDREEIVSAEEAADRIIETASMGQNDSGLSIVSVKKETREYMPDTVYEKDETMLAGDSKVVYEGKEGIEEVTISVTSINGDVAEEEDIDSVIIEEGESPVIIKGILGLPEGEDWETYTGDPVANNGGEVITTAKQYIGKVRYRKGGTSLSTGVDCVGFVRAIYRLYGIDLPANLRKQGKHVSYSDARAGDIICYAKHYGIYIGGGKMVHATSGKGISIGTVSLKKLRDIRRIIH